VRRVGANQRRRWHADCVVNANVASGPCQRNEVKESRMTPTNDPNAEARIRIAEWGRKAVDGLRRKPLLGAGIAAAAGFLLGGGLTNASTLRVLGKSVRLAFQLAVVPALVSRLEDAIVGSARQPDLGR
jgi:hypothetical protein